MTEDWEQLYAGLDMGFLASDLIPGKHGRLIYIIKYFVCMFVCLFVCALTQAIIFLKDETLQDRTLTPGEGLYI